MVHPSLLPKYRGAAPIQHALLADEPRTGVSIAEVSARKFDAGRVFLQEPLEIRPSDTYRSLAEALVALSGRLANRLIDGEHLAREPMPQDEQQATPAPKFAPDGNVYLLERAEEPRTVQLLYCKYRAFCGSAMNTLKLRVRGRHLLVDECFPLRLAALGAEPRPAGLGAADEERLHRLHAALRVGQLATFPQVKPLRHKVGVTLEDGWLVLDRLHFAGGPLRSAKDFVREELSTDAYRAFAASLDARQTGATHFDLLQIE